MFFICMVWAFFAAVPVRVISCTIFVFYGATLGHILDEILCREICEYYKLKCE